MDAWIEAIPELSQFIETKLISQTEGQKKFRIEDIMEFNSQQESFVESLMSLKLPLKRMGVDLKNWNMAEKSLHQYVLQCVKYLETKNFVQLLETLEYDGSRVLEEWKTLLMNLKKEAQGLVQTPTAAVFSFPGSKRNKS